MQPTISSINTFDLYKLNMSKDVVVLRRQYDRLKHDLKAKRDRMIALEREWDSLHSLNTRDNNFNIHKGALKNDNKRSTILTADMGTEKKDEYVNLD